MWFMDFLVAILLRGTAWTREGGETAAGQSRLRAAHPSALTNPAQLLSNGRSGARAPPWALGTLLLGQHTEWALSAR